MSKRMNGISTIEGIIKLFHLFSSLLHAFFWSFLKKTLLGLVWPLLLTHWDQMHRDGVFSLEYSFAVPYLCSPSLSPPHILFGRILNKWIHQSNKLATGKRYIWALWEQSSMRIWSILPVANSCSMISSVCQSTHWHDNKTTKGMAFSFLGGIMNLQTCIKYEELDDVALRFWLNFSLDMVEQEENVFDFHFLHLQFMATWEWTSAPHG